jgi:hypothetical protein
MKNLANGASGSAVVARGVRGGSQMLRGDNSMPYLRVRYEDKLVILTSIVYPEAQKFRRMHKE